MNVSYRNPEESQATLPRVFDFVDPAVRWKVWKEEERELSDVDGGPGGGAGGDDALPRGRRPGRLQGESRLSRPHPRLGLRCPRGGSLPLLEEKEQMTGLAVTRPLIQEIDFNQTVHVRLLRQGAAHHDAEDDARLSPLDSKELLSSRFDDGRRLPRGG